jgi:hypothetical protein
MTPIEVEVILAEKYLFEKFAEDRRIYNLNQGYWKRLFQSRLSEIITSENTLFRNVDSTGSKIYDANPIFTYINHQRTKAIRIIQDDIRLFERESVTRERFLISAWLDKISIDEDHSLDQPEKRVNELVIALFITKTSVAKAMDLVVMWLDGELTTDIIDEIINE